MRGYNNHLTLLLLALVTSSQRTVTAFTPLSYYNYHGRSRNNKKCGPFSSSDDKTTTCTTTTTALGLVPLSNFREELEFFSLWDETRCCIDPNGKFMPSNNNKQTNNDDDDGSSVFEICLVEEEDLPEVSLFIVKAFGADAISLSSNEFSEFERGLMAPAVDFFNGYAAISAFAEVLWGLRMRQSDRISLTNYCVSMNQNKNKEEQQQRENDAAAAATNNTIVVVNDISPPQLDGLETAEEQVNAANRKSLVLVLARQNNKHGNNSNKTTKWESIESNIDVIASVELRLQPCDAKIPFSIPWWDNIERKIASFFGFPPQQQLDATLLQPYLSTLCVDETYRGQQIGRVMVRCLEDIVVTKWGYSKMYLHVDGDNKAALNLYQSEGYQDVGRRWNPFWAGKAAEIGYFVKDLKNR